MLQPGLFGKHGGAEMWLSALALDHYQLAILWNHESAGPDDSVTQKLC
jgi:hypothetical protein